MTNREMIDKWLYQPIEIKKTKIQIPDKDNHKLYTMEVTETCYDEDLTQSVSNFYRTVINDIEERMRGK